MKIAAWNVNSLKVRLPQLLDWLAASAPDVVCLQETKLEDANFPRAEIEAAGYQVAFSGQKTYNGVALLSKFPMEDVRRGLPGGEDDEQARYIEAVIGAPRPIRVGGIYLPNGNPIGTEKFAYKLAWMERLKAHAQALLALEEPLVLLGDYNVIPGPEDADKPEDWAGDALFQPESRAAYRALKWLGLTDAYEQADGRAGGYTFWDYQAMAWQRNHGIRIDHALLSPQAADRLVGVEIHRDVRAREKPSDHVPVMVELDL